MIGGSARVTPGIGGSLRVVDDQMAHLLSLDEQVALEAIEEELVQFLALLGLFFGCLGWVPATGARAPGRALRGRARARAGRRRRVRRRRLGAGKRVLVEAPRDRDGLLLRVDGPREVHRAQPALAVLDLPA